MDGPASLTILPFSSSIARTRPNTEPTNTASPRRIVPDCISTVATGPLPLSRRASITNPLACVVRGAFNSNTSACNKTPSSNLSMPCPDLEETSTNIESPPQSSGTTPSATSSCLTRSTLASGLSTLVIATTRSEEHTSELQSPCNLVCRLLL